MLTIWHAVVALLRTLLYGWILALGRLIAAILRAIRRRPRPQTGTPRRPTADTDCVRLDDPAFLRPDPLLYSQRQLLARGLAVTWDNPDIVLLKNGAPVGSHELDPATTYDVSVRVWNNSTEAPVIGMPVRLSFLDFGVGTVSIPIGTGTVDVGVKGSSTQPAHVSIPWTTPATPGHYCLQALLDPVDDVDRGNNLGQENTDIRPMQSPAEFTFELRNRAAVSHTYRFELDSYALPALPPCSAREPRDKTLARHLRSGHPVPDDFAVSIVPARPQLAAGAQTTITVSVEGPSGFVGAQPLNVNVFHEHGFVGGVTLTAVKEV
jgi:hypothetical protein